MLNLKKRNITKNWLWGFYLIFLFSIFFGVVDNGNIYSGIIGYEIVSFLDIYISYLGLTFLLIFMSLIYLTFRLKIGVKDVMDSFSFIKNLKFWGFKKFKEKNDFDNDNSETTNEPIDNRNLNTQNSSRKEKEDKNPKIDNTNTSIDNDLPSSNIKIEVNEIKKEKLRKKTEQKS